MADQFAWDQLHIPVMPAGLVLKHQRRRYIWGCRCAVEWMLYKEDKRHRHPGLWLRSKRPSHELIVEAIGAIVGAIHIALPANLISTSGGMLRPHVKI